MFTLSTSPTKKILVFLKNYKIQITDIVHAIKLVQGNVYTIFLIR